MTSTSPPVALSLTYGFVDIVAQAKTEAYTPVTVDGEAATQLSYPADGLGMYMRRDRPQGPAAYLGTMDTGYRRNVAGEKGYRVAGRFIESRICCRIPAALAVLRGSAYPGAEF